MAACAEWLAALAWGQEEELAPSASDVAHLVKEGADLQVGALALVCSVLWVEVQLQLPCSCSL